MVLLGCQEDASTEGPELAATESGVVNVEEVEENNADSDLDVLKQYDRDLWSGPEGWTEEQWRWKRALKWDKHCDYVGDVEVLDLPNAQQLIQVTCVPGAYQPMHYLFVFDPNSGDSVQLELGEYGEHPREIMGNVSLDGEGHLKILHLSRGVGDCGTLRTFHFQDTLQTPALIEKREQDCSEQPLSENERARFLDPEKWPLVIRNEAP